jgi:hypothetical protein
MPSKKPPRGKKFYTVAEANAALPLVKAILRDITDLANNLHERYERMSRAGLEKGALPDAYQEELEHAHAAFENDQDRMRDFENELEKLGVLLKDYGTGLVDFPCWMDNHEVYLCWRLGEAEVGHWHEIDAGFAGRRKIHAAPVEQLRN